MSLFGRDHGVKMNVGGFTTREMHNRRRTETLRKLHSEGAQFDKDPYLVSTEGGMFMCKLCSTRFRMETSYLRHREGKEHRENLVVREYRLKQKKSRTFGVDNDDMSVQLGAGNLNSGALMSSLPTSAAPLATIGLPSYSVARLYDSHKKRHGLLIRVDYPLIQKGLRPRYQCVKPQQQQVEANDIRYQYIVLAAAPYDNIAIKVPNVGIVRGDQLLQIWDEVQKSFTLQIVLNDDVADGHNSNGNNVYSNPNQQQSQQPHQNRRDDSGNGITPSVPMGDSTTQGSIGQ